MTRSGELLPPGRILVIDDNDLVVQVIRLHLEPAGHEVVTASSCDQAIELLGQSTFDVIVSDLQMPGIGGLGILAFVADNEIDSPVIMLSGNAETAMVLEAIHKGAFDYVLKDGHPAPLHSAVSRALAHVRLIRQNHALVDMLQEINQHLEEQVAERTQALSRTNERLSQESEELQRTIRDLQQTERRLFQADKIASIGMLTAGVAHEINNPLAFLMPNVETIHGWLEALPAGTPMPEGLESRTEIMDLVGECGEGLTRIRDIVRQLSLFSRQDVPDPERVQVSSLVRTLVQFTSSEIKHHAELSFELDDSCFVLACPGHLHQVLLNLLVNAARAIPSETEGRIHLSVKQESGIVAIAVSDNGVGIAPGDIRKIFEPFYTTRRGAEGTGLGLSVSLELSKKMGGTIEVESVLGQGTTMTLRLPLSHERAARPRQATGRDEDSIEGRGSSILLLDDEEATLKTFQRVLAHDHQVFAFSNGDDALAWLRVHDLPSLLLCDIMMPEMSGPEFYEAARKLHPQIGGRTLFMTGGAVTKDAQDFLTQHASQVRFKPMSIHEIEDLPNQVPLDAP